MTYQPYDPIQNPGQGYPPPISGAPYYDPAQQYPPTSGSPYYDPAQQYPAQQYPPSSGVPYYSPVQPSGPPASPVPYYAPAPLTPAPYQPSVVLAIAAPPSSGSATAALVFGIIGIMVGYCLLGIPCILAVVFGHIGLIQTRDGQRSGRGMAVAGLVLGYICVIPMIIFTVLIFGAIIGGGATANSGTY